MLIPTRLALATLLSLVFTPLTAQDFNKGLAAYQASDYATAFQEWTPLAEQGNAPAQTNLGLMYRKGQSVPQDYAEASRLFLLAAEQGFARAQYWLGFMYLSGQGVPQEKNEAIKWYRLAAEQGFSGAQLFLGDMYAKGDSVLQDNVMAHMWFNIASANGVETAGEYRNERAGLMTTADISKAQAMARECMSSGYIKCGY